MAENRDRGECCVSRLLDAEQHAAHRVAHADGHEVWQRRQAGHQGAGHEPLHDGAVGVVIDRAGQPRGDEEDVVDRRGVSDAQVVERGDHESRSRRDSPPCCSRDSLRPADRSTRSNTCRRQGSRGGSATPRRRADGARIQPLRVKVPGNGTQIGDVNGDRRRGQIAPHVFAEGVCGHAAPWYVP